MGNSSTKCTVHIEDKLALQSINPGDRNLTFKYPVEPTELTNNCSYVPLTNTLKAYGGEIYLYIPQIDKQQGDTGEFCDKDNPWNTNPTSSTYYISKIPQYTISDNAGFSCQTIDSNNSKNKYADKKVYGVIGVDKVYAQTQFTVYHGDEGDVKVGPNETPKIACYYYLNDDSYILKNVNLENLKNTITSVLNLSRIYDDLSKCVDENIKTMYRISKLSQLPQYIVEQPLGPPLIEIEYPLLYDNKYYMANVIVEDTTDKYLSINGNDVLSVFFKQLLNSCELNGGEIIQIAIPRNGTDLFEILSIDDATGNKFVNVFNSTTNPEMFYDGNTKIIRPSIIIAETLDQSILSAFDLIASVHYSSISVEDKFILKLSEEITGTDNVFNVYVSKPAESQSNYDAKLVDDNNVKYISINYNGLETKESSRLIFKRNWSEKFE